MKKKNILSLLFLWMGVGIGICYADNNFTVYYQGEELIAGADNQIEITEYEDNGLSVSMKFPFTLDIHTQKSTTITLSKDQTGTLSGTQNDMCWGVCVSPDQEIISQTFDGKVSRTDETYTTYHPQGIPGTSTIIYTFKSSIRGQEPIVITVKFTYNPPSTATITNVGSSLVLEGDWNATDFDQVNSKADESITSIDMSAIEIPEDAPEITPANPNCLIYVSEIATVPTTWKNVVKGNEAEEVTLTDGYAFCNTKTFTAKQISYTRNYPQEGWSSLYLPFGATELPKGIRIESYSDYKNNTAHFTPIVSSVIEANIPYLAEITSCDTKTFSAIDVQVEESNVTGNVEQGSFIFKGTYSLLTGNDATDLYILDSSDGSGFIKANDTNSIPAFRAYLQAKDGNETLRVTVKHDNTSHLENTLSDNSFNAYGYQGKLFIIADKETDAKIFSVDGRRVKTVNLHEGENIIEDLNNGLYIINNQKVSIQE